MRLYDSRGGTVELAEKIAQGGEGSVHRVVGRPDSLAKVYHRPPSAERIRKLEAMVSLQSEDILGLACWPTETVSQKPTGGVTGFLMPNAKGHKEVFKLYNPKSRQVEFKSVQWGFLVHSATNMARAFASMHRSGHVIGDVNHSSVMISQSATAKLIDCDSFQVRFRDEVFPCEVGEFLHTAPELQGRNLSSLSRSPNHDNFGLAVLVFELLFMGRHPFAGSFAGGDLSLEEKIKGFRFAYGPGAKGRLMTAPPHTLALEAVSAPVTDLFERAFSSDSAFGDGRPSAMDWVGGLVGLESALKSCGGDASHMFWSGLGACPWCDIETHTGVSNFTVVFTKTGRADFEPALVWGAIGKIPAPANDPVITEDTLPATEPTPRYASLRRQRRDLRVAGVLLGAVAFVASVVSKSTAEADLLLAALPLVTGWIGSSLIGVSAANEAQKNLMRAKRTFETCRSKWLSTASVTIFSNRLTYFEEKKRQYEDLAGHRQREFKRLQAGVRERQLRRFLDQYLIQPGVIAGVGAGRCATLASYGIQTAGDVDFYKILPIQGFGEVTTLSMVAWRKEIEALFAFDPSVGVDKQDLDKLEGDMANLRSSLEQELTGAPYELTQIARRIESARKALSPQLERVSNELALAKANARILQNGRFL